MFMKNHSIAIYGLGVMGGSLAKNLLSRGCRVSLYSKSGEERDRFSASCTEGDMCSTQEEMLRGMAPPRVIFLMITAGSPVDQVLEELAPHLKREMWSSTAAIPTIGTPAGEPIPFGSGESTTWAWGFPAVKRAR